MPKASGDRGFGGMGKGLIASATIVAARPAHLPAWGEMRAALWPWESAEDHAAQASGLYLAGHPDRQAFVALSADATPVGFAEATLRRDYVEGCDSSPVGFLEGILVVPSMRQRGIARALVDAVGEWARARDCREYASNALLDNADSHAFHAAVGFADTERVVFYRKPL